jgi:hypothetical protein
LSEAQAKAEMARLVSLAEQLKAQGLPLRTIAHRLVNERLKLQSDSLRGSNLDICDIVEVRNRTRFGQVAGPTAIQLYEIHGKWESVIDAACQLTDEQPK